MKLRVGENQSLTVEQLRELTGLLAVGAAETFENGFDLSASFIKWGTAHELSCMRFPQPQQNAYWVVEAAWNDIVTAHVRLLPKQTPPLGRWAQVATFLGAYAPKPPADMAIDLHVNGPGDESALYQHHSHAATVYLTDNLYEYKLPDAVQRWAAQNGFGFERMPHNHGRDANLEKTTGGSPVLG